MIVSANKYSGWCAWCSRWVNSDAGFVEAPKVDGGKFTLLCHDCGTTAIDIQNGRSTQGEPTSPVGPGNSDDDDDLVDDPAPAPDPDPTGEVPPMDPGIPPEIAAFVAGEMAKFQAQLRVVVAENARLKAERLEAIRGQDAARKESAKARRRAQNAEESVHKLRAEVDRLFAMVRTLGGDPSSEAERRRREAENRRREEAREEARRKYRAEEEAANRRRTADPGSFRFDSGFSGSYANFDFSDMFNNARAGRDGPSNPYGRQPGPPPGATIFPPPPSLAILGLGADATPDQVRAAYRDKAKVAHPDAGGTTADFVRLKEAYDLALKYTEIRARGK